MKVSSKIIAGFLIVMLLAIVVLANQLSVIHQMQTINRELSEIDMNAASSVLRMEEVAAVIKEDSRKYFATGDPIYDQQIAELRQDFQTSLAGLRKNARSDRERSETQKLASAIEDFANLFDRAKNQTQQADPDYLPVDVAIAVDHLQAQTEIAYEGIKGSVKEQVARAAVAGQKAERVSWIAGLFSLFLGAIVAALIVQSINEPLRRLTRGTRAIAKGEFWHRLPADGRDEFSELARDFNVMTEKLAVLDQMKKDFVSHVSHDLKAPLASIRQVMHLLLQEIPGSLNDQQKELLRLSYDSSEQWSEIYWIYLEWKQDPWSTTWRHMIWCRWPLALSGNSTCKRSRRTFGSALKVICPPSLPNVIATASCRSLEICSKTL
jgi:nitrate/nitrite-specific signal transduction histidine kinase